MRNCEILYGLPVGSEKIEIGYFYLASSAIRHAKKPLKPGKTDQLYYSSHLFVWLIKFNMKFVGLISDYFY